MGAAYVFQKSGVDWSTITQVAELTTSDPAEGNCISFGISVAISGDVIVIGSSSESADGMTRSGAAYVFLRPAGGWSGNLTETAKLTATNKNTNDFFGEAVAISGDVVAVGAYAKSNNIGAAYVFVKPVNGWASCPLVNSKPECSESAKLIPSDLSVGDFFGLALAVDRQKIVVGAPRLDSGNGKAYVFVEPLNGWSGNLAESCKLVASDSISNDWFGWSVALQSNVVVIGARYRSVAKGAVYVFNRPSNGWVGIINQSVLLTASINDGVGLVGSSVAIQDNVIITGAPASLGEAVLVFVEPAGGWNTNMTETAKLDRQDHPATEQGDFGVSVALSGEALIVGDDWGNPGGISLAGAAYVYNNQWAITYTVSGNAGVPGATLSYTDGTAKTATADPSGNYSFPVSYKWAGTVTPSMAHCVFSPASRTYTNVLADQTGQTYTASACYNLSGNTGVAGAILSYTDGTPKTATADASGNYSFPVSYSWSGKVKPSKVGYTFSPTNLRYMNVLSDQAGQDYTAIPITYTISGNAGVGGATLSYTDGTAKTATADPSGNYSFTISYNWSGTVTPSLSHYIFSPASLSYTNVLADQPNQNYTAIHAYQISGNAGVAGATLKYTGGSTVADASGNYTFTVISGWSGLVSPSLNGYTFSPVNMSYTNITADLTGQNYTAVPAFTISGNVGRAGMMLTYTVGGVTQTAFSDSKGNYSFLVPQGWSGQVVPVVQCGGRNTLKKCYFTPSMRSYTSVTTDLTHQDYTLVITH